jgi:hypothetical protein
LEKRCQDKSEDPIEAKNENVNERFARTFGCLDLGPAGLQWVENSDGEPYQAGGVADGRQRLLLAQR